MRVLIVEDEERIRSFLEDGLQAEGFATVAARDGEEGVAFGSDPQVDAVILDVMLPKQSGYQVLAALRARRPGLPVLMLTALGDTTERVKGLDAGADDYLPKPFAFEELLARLRAVLRRRDQASTVVAGQVALDLHTHAARVAGAQIELTAREFALLEFLMRHRDRVVGRREILRAVWAIDFDPQSTLLETTMNRLRRKITVPGGAPPIETVRGEGYRFSG